MNQQATTIKQLYPNLSETELKLAEENLTAYLGLVLRIYSRLEQEGTLKVLTEAKTFPRIQAKVESNQF
jgi:hypothetical protein